MFQSPRGESIVKGCRLKLALGNCPQTEIDASRFCRSKTVSLFQDLKILASEMPTESGIDAIQRSHAVFKVRVDRVDDASTPLLCRIQRKSQDKAIPKKIEGQIEATDFSCPSTLKICNQFVTKVLLKDICLGGWLRWIAADRQRLRQTIRSNPVKPHIILSRLHLSFHLIVQFFHLRQRHKALKHAFLHPPPVPFQKICQLLTALVIRNIVND